MYEVSVASSQNRASAGGSRARPRKDEEKPLSHVRCTGTRGRLSWPWEQKQHVKQKQAEARPRAGAYLRGSQASGMRFLDFSPF